MPGIVVALAAAMVSVFGSVCGLLLAKRSKLIVKTDGKIEQFEVSPQEARRIKAEHELRPEGDANRSHAAAAR